MKGQTLGSPGKPRVLMPPPPPLSLPPPGRRYYKNVAQKMPETSAILTLGCAKFRLLGHDYGNLPGTELPRLMDVGQCNDSYAAVRGLCQPAAA